MSKFDHLDGPGVKFNLNTIQIIAFLLVYENQSGSGIISDRTEGMDGYSGNDSIFSRY